MTKDEIRQAAEDSLERFIALVSPHRVLGDCHRELIKWWTRDDAGDHQMCLLPRDHQKSAMIAYRVAWEITKDPALTVLYISSTSNLAEKQLKFIKDILLSPTYRRYWPEMVNPEEGKREKWTTSEIALDHPIRAAEGIREPTIVTAGLTTSITGLHFMLAVLDDVVVKENAYTEEGRKKVGDQYSLLSSIESGEAREWIVGTRYHPKDLYGTLIELEEEVISEEGEIVDSQPVYEVYQRVVEDIGDGTGAFLWPRQQRGDGKWFGFNAAILAKKRAKYLDKTQYYAQYYNNPNDPGNEQIESKYFQSYDPKFLKKLDGKWTYNGRPLNIFAAIDFAYSLSARADWTAIVVIGVDWDGNIYVLDLERIKTKKTADYFNLCRDKHMKWGFTKLSAEVTAAQEVIVERIKDDIRQEGLRLSVDHYRPTRTMGTKEERIQNTLTPYYENYSVWHPAHGMTEILESELKMEKPPHDDLKDALHNAVRIMKVPAKSHARRRNTKVVTHGRFGGVAA